MKKFIFAAAACCMLAVGASLVSCDANKPQCWKLTAVYDDVTIEAFFYGSGVEADAQLEVHHRAGAKSIRREQTFLSQENCHK